MLRFNRSQDKIAHPDKELPFPPRAFLVAGPIDVPLLVPVELTSDIPLTELISSLSKLRLFLVLDAIISFQKGDLTSKFLENKIYWIQNSMSSCNVKNNS